MKPMILGLAALAALALPAAHALAGGCGGGPVTTADQVAAMTLGDLPSGALNNPTLLQYVENQFDPALQTTLPPSKLAEDWQIFQGQLGAFRSVGSPVDQANGTQTVVTMPVQFSNGSGALELTVNPDLTIDSLRLIPAS